MKKITTINLLGILVIVCSMLPLAVSAEWDTKADIPTFGGGRWGAHTFALDGKIFLGGGYVGNNSNLNDLVSYDPSTDQWNFHNDLPGSTGNRTGGIAFVINNKAYIGLGSENYNNFTAQWNFLTDLWEYDPSNDTWTQKANFPGTGVAFPGTFIIGEKIYVVGGATGKQSADGTNAVYEYNASTDKWTKKADFPEAMIANNPFGFSLNDKGYISGGSNGASISNKTYEYDPANDSWTSKAAYPESQISGGVSFVANGVAYCGLGSTGSSQYIDYFWYYNPSSDSWAYANGFEFNTTSRMWSVTATLNNKVYMGAGWRIDGGTTAQTFFNDWFEVDPTVAVGINKTNSNNDLLIYPNPATDRLYVNTDKQFSNYTIYAIDGRLMSNGSISSGKTINITNLPAGQYLLEVRSPEDAHQQLFTVTK